MGRHPVRENAKPPTGKTLRMRRTSFRKERVEPTSKREWNERDACFIWKVEREPKRLKSPK